MRKSFFLLCSIILVLTMLCSLSFASEVYKISIDIDFLGNLIFSKYDVDMCFNDLELERLLHGKDYSGSFYAEAGPATIYFYNHDSKSVSGSIKLDIKGNTTISCQISCYNNRIEVDNLKIDMEEPEEIPSPTLEPIVSATPAPTPEPKPVEAVIPVPESEFIADITNENPENDNADLLTREMPTDKPVSFANVDLHSMSDKELADAITSIKAEQRSRIKTRIVLDATSISLVPGKTQKIEAHFEELPTEEASVPMLEWSSSDNKVATVKNGTIKAIGGGNAVISCYASLRDGTAISQDCNVQVIILASAVSSDQKTINLKVDEKQKPTFTFKPDNVTSRELTFSSSDEKVATVDQSGTITGEWVGKAKITASTTDGSKKAVSIDVVVTYDAYLKESNGKNLFNAVCSSCTSVKSRMEGGSADWYDHMADVDGINFEVNSKGEYGKALVISVMDIQKIKKKDVFFTVLDNVFFGDDLIAATNWVKKNLGKETSTKIGDANIVLRLTVMNTPIMYILDDEHLDWI